MKTSCDAKQFTVSPAIEMADFQTIQNKEFCLCAQQITKLTRSLEFLAARTFTQLGKLWQNSSGRPMIMNLNGFKLDQHES